MDPSGHSAQPPTIFINSWDPHSPVFNFIPVVTVFYNASPDGKGFSLIQATKDGFIITVGYDGNVATEFQPYLFDTAPNATPIDTMLAMRSEVMPQSKLEQAATVLVVVGVAGQGRGGTGRGGRGFSGTTEEANNTGYPNKTVVKENGVTIEHNYPNDHGNPAHLHVKGGGPNTKIGPQGLPTKGQPQLTPKQSKVVQNNLPKVKKTVKTIQKTLKKS